MKHPILVAVDGGSGNIAVRYSLPDGEVKSFLMRSVIRRGNLQQGNKESLSTWRTGDDQVFSVTSTGSRMDLVDTCDPQYQISDANRVLIIDALVKAGLEDVDIILADTLPANQYYGAGKTVDQKRINAKKESLMQPVSSYSGKVKPPRIVEVKIWPEAVPAFVSASFNDDGTPNEALEGVQYSIVVDIGRFTCDIAMLDPNDEVIDRLTTENGIHVMLNRFQELLEQEEEKLGINEAREISPAALDTIINNGFIGSAIKAMEKKRINIQHLALKAASELSERIKEDIRSMHRNLSDIDCLLVVGGGANWLGGKLDYMPNFAESWFPNGFVYIPENPELAVVRGVHLLAAGEAQQLEDDE